MSFKSWSDNLPNVFESPPQAQFRFVDERRQYACRVVTVRDDLHEPLSAIVWVTRQDKETPYRLDGIVQLAVGSLARGINLLIVDLFPPSKRDPQGIHKLIWDRIQDVPYELPPAGRSRSPRTRPAR